ncbi:MAG: SDR family oxidoreductase [Myxococcota bacterium]|nr:SDR family oxidoreductase [Myxococcota bacterium]
MHYDGIEGKVAIVTGAGGGIGEAYAQGLAGQGAKVVVAEIHKENGERAAEAIRSQGGEACFVHVDVGDPESTTQMAEQVIERYGGIDLLVNNAAIFGDMKLDSLLNVDWDYYQKFMNVNMNGALLCSRACFRSMKERGGGAIVNQSSTAAWMGVGFYGLAKLGINGVTHCLSKELGPQGIRVNAIAPGPTQTEALAKTAGDYVKQMIPQLSLQRLGEPADLVETCLFLLSDGARWLTGQIVNVDGGQITRP